jgi:hypothetical protein
LVADAHALERRVGKFATPPHGSRPTALGALDYQASAEERADDDPHQHQPRRPQVAENTLHHVAKGGQRQPRSPRLPDNNTVRPAAV